MFSVRYFFVTLCPAINATVLRDVSRTQVSVRALLSGEIAIQAGSYSLSACGDIPYLFEVQFGRSARRAVN
jgi:hypothetical protein